MTRQPKDLVSSEYPAALTVAGSDSGGGAGIQADLKTFEALHVFGTCAVTCVTAQNPGAVAGIMPIDPAMVALQIETVCDAFPIAAVKTGMLFSSEIIHAVAQALDRHDLHPRVVDPVMVASSGARLLREDAIEALTSVLLPKADVLTPNLAEAEILQGAPIRSPRDMATAAARIGEAFSAACIVKGGHLPGQEIPDVLYVDGGTHVFTGARLNTAHTHGTGCTFSAALTALLVHGRSLIEAVPAAQAFVRRVLKGRT